MRGADVGKLLVLNIAYWYVPALLIPAIATVARRFPLDSRQPAADDRRARLRQR